MPQGSPSHPQNFPEHRRAHSLPLCAQGPVYFPGKPSLITRAEETPTLSCTCRDVTRTVGGDSARTSNKNAEAGVWLLSCTTAYKPRPLKPVPASGPPHTGGPRGGALSLEKAPRGAGRSASVGRPLQPQQRWARAVPKLPEASRPGRRGRDRARRPAFLVRRPGSGPGPGWGVAPFLEPEFYPGVHLLSRCKMGGNVLVFQDLILDPAIALNGQDAPSLRSPGSFGQRAGQVNRASDGFQGSFY